MAKLSGDMKPNWGSNHEDTQRKGTTFMKNPIAFITVLVGAIVIGALVQTAVDRHSEQWAEWAEGLVRGCGR